MRFLSDHLIVVTLLVIALAAGLIWLDLPAPRAPKPRAVPEQPWSLPRLGRTDPGASARAIAARELWGANLAGTGGGAGAKGKAAPAWRFVGTVERGHERTAVILVGAEPAAELKVGDRLPDGAIIVGIEQDALQVESNGQKRSMALY